MRKALLTFFCVLAVSLANAQNGCPTMNSFTWNPSAQVGDGRHVATASISVSLNQFNGQFFAINFLGWPSSSDECEAPSFRTVFAFSCYLPMGSTSMTDMAFISGASDQPYNVDTQAYVACGNNSLLHANFTVLPAQPNNPNPDPSDTNATCAECAGSPINLGNGNTWIEQNDYSVSDFRGGVSLTRTWHSGWSGFNPPATVGMFGSGWTSNFEQRLQQTTVAGTSGYKTWNGSGNSEFFRYDSTFGTYAINAPFDSVSGLVSNGNSTFTYTLKDGTQETFDSNGYLTAIKDRNGNTTTITLDSQHRITQVQNAAGRTLTFAYTDSNNPNQAKTVSDGCNSCVGGAIVATYDYTQDGINHLLTKVTYSDGTVLSFQYQNGTTLISEVDDGAGKVIEKHGYDSQRRGTSSSKAVVAGSSTPVDYLTVTYPQVPQPISAIGLTNSQNQGTAYDFVTTGQRHLLTDAVGPGCSTCISRSKINHYYSSAGELAVEVDANGNSFSYAYDANHNIASRATNVYDYNGNHIAKQTFGYTYNSFGEVTSATDPLGRVTNYNYDTHGNLLYVQTPSPDGGTTQGSKTQFGYDPAGTGEITSITDPLNNVTTIHYNASGLVDYTLDAQQKQTQFQYDGRGNRTQVTDPMNNVTGFTYDGRNRLTKITYPDLSTTQYGYDSTRGRLHTVTDQNSKVTTYDYDDADRLVAVTDAQTQNAGVTHYAYDTEDNLTSITDALGRVTCFQYNNNGWLTETDFQAGTGCTSTTIHETFTYDNVGNLQSKTDRNSKTINYYYDSLNRLNYKSWANASPAYTATYTYKNVAQLDGTMATVNLLGSLTDPSGTYSFIYDDMDRLTETDTTYSFLSGLKSVKYSYDPASNRKSLTDPQNNQTTYNYDTLNRLYQLVSQYGTFTYGYDADSRRTSLNRPNAVNTTFTYDTCKPLKLCSILHKLGSTTLDGATYAFSYLSVPDNINWKQKTDNLNGDVYGYVYDNIYQLTKLYKNGTATNTPGYDLVGNNTVFGHSQYNNANELTLRDGFTSIGYDGNGNQISAVATGTNPGTYTYNWDYENRLTSFLPPPGNTNLFQYMFTYDPFGRRVRFLAKNNTTGATITDLTYIYDGANTLQQLSTSTGLPSKKFVSGLGVDEWLAYNNSSGTSFFESDALGTITSQTNSSGAVTDTYAYGIWGGPSHPTGTSDQPFRYTGLEYDGCTNWYYQRARYRDPATGRFVSEDPLRFDAGANFYSYVHNNPMNFSDPSGWSSHCLLDPDSRCAKLFQIVLGMTARHYNNAVNNIPWFYSPNSSTFSHLTWNDIAQNGDNTFVSSSFSGSNEAVTGGGGPLPSPVVLGPDWFTDHSPAHQNAVMLHESVHSLTGHNDQWIFEHFNPYGLPTGDFQLGGNTDAFTNWLMAGCPKN